VLDRAAIASKVSAEKSASASALRSASAKLLVTVRTKRLFKRFDAGRLQQAWRSPRLVEIALNERADRELESAFGLPDRSSASQGLDTLAASGPRSGMMA